MGWSVGRSDGPYIVISKKKEFLYENPQGHCWTLLNVLGVLGVLNVFDVLNVLDMLIAQ